MRIVVLLVLVAGCSLFAHSPRRGSRGEIVCRDDHAVTVLDGTMTVGFGLFGGAMLHATAKHEGELASVFAFAAAIPALALAVTYTGVTVHSYVKVNECRAAKARASGHFRRER